LASTTVAFGEEQLIGLLKQFQLLHKNQVQLYVGLFECPNVGNSFVINALRQEKIFLIDCSGYAYPENANDAERVFRSVTQSERIEDPEHYIPYIVDRVRPQYLERTYGIDPDDMLEKAARMMGGSTRATNRHARSVHSADKGLPDR
jgi:nuclear GTP-binding protein